MVDSQAEPEPAFPTEADINAILGEFHGDAREAIRALLHDLAVLAADYESSVSKGYVRGAIPILPVRNQAARG